MIRPYSNGIVRCPSDRRLCGTETCTISESSQNKITVTSQQAISQPLMAFFIAPAQPASLGLVCTAHSTAPATLIWCVGWHGHTRSARVFRDHLIALRARANEFARATQDSCPAQPMHHFTMDGVRPSFLLACLRSPQWELPPWRAVRSLPCPE